MRFDARTYWTERARTQGATYVARGGRPDAYRRDVHAASPILTRLLPAGGTLLDFGCGVGRFVPLLSTLADTYVGVDLVWQDASRWPPNARFRRLETDAIPFPDGHFDTVVCLWVLQHVVEPEDFALWCGEIGRVLRPGGTLVAWDHDAPMEDPDPHMRPRGPEAIAEAAGVGVFRVERADDRHWVGTGRK